MSWYSKKYTFILNVVIHILIQWGIKDPTPFETLALHSLLIVLDTQKIF